MNIAQKIVVLGVQKRNVQEEWSKTVIARGRQGKSSAINAFLFAKQI